MSSQSSISQPPPSSPLPLTANRLGTVRTYIEMRNELWKGLSCLASLQMSPYSLGLLELCNRVVRTLLMASGERALRREAPSGASESREAGGSVRGTEAGPESVFRALETLKCGICETWIARVRYELKVLTGGDRNGQRHIDVNYLRNSLKLALSPERPLPAPVPSSFEPPSLP